MRREADIICRELAHLRVMADVGVTGSITQKLHLILEQRVAAVHHRLCTLGGLQQRFAVQLIRRDKVHFATAETEHQHECCG